MPDENRPTQPPGLDPASLEALIETLDRHVSTERQSRPPDPEETGSHDLIDAQRTFITHLKAKLIDREGQLSDERDRRDSAAIRKSKGNWVEHVKSFLTIGGVIVGVLGWYTGSRIDNALAAERQTTRAAIESAIDQKALTDDSRFAAKELVAVHQQRFTTIDRDLDAIKVKLDQISAKLDRRR